MAEYSYSYVFSNSNGVRDSSATLTNLTTAATVPITYTQAGQYYQVTPNQTVQLMPFPLPSISPFPFEDAVPLKMTPAPKMSPKPTPAKPVKPNSLGRLIDLED